MGQNHRNSIDQKQEIGNIRVASSGPSRPSPAIPASAGFAPSIGQIRDPASVASDVLLHVNGHHVRVSQQLAAHYARRKNWWERLFGANALDRVLADSQLRQAKSECDLNERLLALATQIKYEACREVGEAWVKSLRVGVREQFIAFVTERFENLNATIETRRVEFGRRIRERYRTWESYRDLPELADRYKVSIDCEIDDFYTWLDGLIAGFREIIDQKLGEYNHETLRAP